MGKIKMIPFISLNGEIWKPIIGYDGYYEVSNFGRIRSMYDADRSGLKKLEHPKLKSFKIGKDGRFRVRLGFSIHKDKMWLVHKLVANTFLSDEKIGLQINHIDGNCKNNHINNLEYITASENMIHGFKMGLFKNRIRGTRVSISKLKDENIIYILNSEKTHRELAKEFSVSSHAIFCIKNGKTWNHITKLPLTRKNKTA